MYSAEPLATRRTLANVKSSATTPRQPSVPNLIWSGMASVSTPRSAADFAASAAGAKEPTSTRGSASRRCVTERAQEATPASAPLSGSPRNHQIPWGETAPGRLGREAARNSAARHSLKVLGFARSLERVDDPLHVLCARARNHEKGILGVDDDHVLEPDRRAPTSFRCRPTRSRRARAVGGRSSP